MGVTDYAFLWCRRCKRFTAHETDWESEDPERLTEWCLEHNGYWVDRKLPLFEAQELDDIVFGVANGILSVH